MVVLYSAYLVSRFANDSPGEEHDIVFPLVLGLSTSYSQEHKVFHRLSSHSSAERATA